MSEGISFNDDNARGVICVGLPYPSARDRCIEAKRAYNDEQRRFRGRKDLLSGNDWYSQQAFRAIAQALGRCIRHMADYGTVILMDSRHCDVGGAKVNGVSLAHTKLPKWMRHHIKNVGFSTAYHMPEKIIPGWAGLESTMKHFFAEASIYSKCALQKQQDALKSVSAKPHNRYFDPKKGVWCEK